MCKCIWIERGVNSQVALVSTYRQRKYIQAYLISRYTFDLIYRYVCVVKLGRTKK